MDKRFKLGSIINFIGGFMLLSTVLLTLFDVFGYWITGRSFAQVQELVLALFVWVVYAGMGELYKTGDQISIDLLEKILPPKANRIVQLIIDSIVLVFSITVTYYAVMLTIRSITKFTPVLKIQYCYIDAAVVLGAATMIFFSIQRIIRNLKTMKQQKRGEE